MFTSMPRSVMVFADGFGESVADDGKVYNLIEAVYFDFLAIESYTCGPLVQIGLDKKWCETTKITMRSGASHLVVGLPGVVLDSIAMCYDGMINGFYGNQDEDDGGDGGDDYNGYEEDRAEPNYEEQGEGDDPHFDFDGEDEEIVF